MDVDCEGMYSLVFPTDNLLRFVLQVRRILRVIAAAAVAVAVACTAEVDWRWDRRCNYCLRIEMPPMAKTTKMTKMDTRDRCLRGRVVVSVARQSRRRRWRPRSMSRSASVPDSSTRSSASPIFPSHEGLNFAFLLIIRLYFIQHFIYSAIEKGRLNLY